MTTYILQKDMPDAPKGTEFESDGRNTYMYLSPDRSYGTIPYQFVERNPTWFLPKGMEEFKEAKDKPPLGLMPKYLHDEKRLEDIRNAMGRFTDAGKVVPQEWIEEEKELIRKMPKEKNVFVIRVTNGGYKEGDNNCVVHLSTGDMVVITKERLAEIVILEKINNKNEEQTDS